METLTASTFQINSWKNWKQVSHRAIFFSAMIRDLWPTMTTHNVYFKMKWEIQWKKNRKCENIVVKWFHKYLYNQWLKNRRKQKACKTALHGKFTVSPLQTNRNIAN